MRSRATLLILLTAGCQISTAPTGWPTNVSTFTPPPSYSVYWKEMESCSGITADLSRVTWFTSDSILNIPGDAFGAFGITDWAGNRIALDGRVVHAEEFNLLMQPNAATVIRHEMLHELLQRSGHPAEYFGDPGRCADELSSGGM